jgi:predicted peptidase
VNLKGHVISLQEVIMRSTIALGLAVSAGLILAGSARAEKPAPGTQVPQSFKKKIVRTVGLDYLVYLPKEYGKDRNMKWPLLLFLHGAGERGSDVNKVKVHGPPKLVAAGQDLPFIVVSPQCPEGQWWDEVALNALLDQAMKDYRVDADRVYLTGLSMGGFGTWALGSAHPERFAALAPICGGGEPRAARRLRNVPVWAFHGAKDSTVPLQSGQEMVDALKAAGGNVKFTVYPEADHDSWTETYNNPELYKWLLAQKRQPASPRR